MSKRGLFADHSRVSPVRRSPLKVFVPRENDTTRKSPLKNTHYVCACDILGRAHTEHCAVVLQDDDDAAEREFLRRREILESQRSQRLQELQQDEDEQAAAVSVGDSKYGDITQQQAQVSETERKRTSLFVTSPPRGKNRRGVLYLTGVNTHLNQTHAENTELQKTLLTKRKETDSLVKANMNLSRKYGQEVQGKVALGYEVTALRSSLEDVKTENVKLANQLAEEQTTKEEVLSELRNLYDDAVGKITELEKVLRNARTSHAEALQEAREENTELARLNDEATQFLKRSKLERERLKNNEEMQKNRVHILENELAQQRILLQQSQQQTADEQRRVREREAQIAAMRSDMETLQQNNQALKNDLLIAEENTTALKTNMYEMEATAADEANEKQRLLLNNCVLLKDKKELLAKVSQDSKANNETLALVNNMKEALANSESIRKKERVQHLTCFLSYRTKTTRKSTFLAWRVHALRAQHRRKVMQLLLKSKQLKVTAAAFQNWQLTMRRSQELELKSVRLQADEEKSKLTKTKANRYHENFHRIRDAKARRCFAAWFYLSRDMSRQVQEGRTEEMKKGLLTLLAEEKNEKDGLVALVKSLERQKQAAVDIFQAQEAKQMKDARERQKRADRKRKEKARMSEAMIKRLCDEKIESMKRRTQRIRDTCQQTSTSMREHSQYLSNRSTTSNVNASVVTANNFLVDEEDEEDELAILDENDFLQLSDTDSDATISE